MLRTYWYLLVDTLQIVAHCFFNDWRAPTQAARLFQAIKTLDQIGGQIGRHQRAPFGAKPRPESTNAFSLNLGYGRLCCHLYK